MLLDPYSINQASSRYQLVKDCKWKSFDVHEIKSKGEKPKGYGKWINFQIEVTGINRNKLRLQFFYNQLKCVQEDKKQNL